MNLAIAFAASAEAHADKTAIYWGDHTFSYRQVLEQSSNLAAYLKSTFGVKPGDRVGLWLKNCPEFVPVLFGILQAGAAVVPLNNFYKPDEVHYILKDAGVQIVISDESMAEQSAAVLELLPGLKVWNVESLGSLPKDSKALPNSGTGDLAVIIYTSGTTGKPKGAMLSHGNLLANVESCRQMLAAVDHDRFVVLLPMFHSFMLTVGVLLPTLIGGSLVVIKTLHPPKNIILEILRHGATILPAIPQFFRSLANAGLPPNQPLRICVSGGAPLPVEILKEFGAKMNVPLIEGYGLSEASPVVSMNPLAGPWKAGSVGVPVPDVEMSVQDDTGQHLPVGQTGEIAVRGSNVMLGYWNQPEETAKALRSGWLLTGDIGHMDADGYYFITDRKKDMLLVNGINVYPREIEEVIYQFPGIKEAAVVGVPDHRRGEQPIAFVSPAEGALLDEKTIHQHVRTRLADYKVPRRIVIIPSLPRNATGKVLKTVLRESVLKEKALDTPVDGHKATEPS
ncbi:MAG TPA: long-chain fatty acid--CoA ligase [Candidatus Saccharimonadales bacterium]|nr:long-chain fatty acid--CoA ligase [Candidatus Saccharimonadales bacterium]